MFENRDIDVLYEGYKSAFFILQAVYYSRNTEFIGTKKELLRVLDGEEKEILLVNLNWDSLDIAENTDFYYEKLINWARRYI